MADSAASRLRSALPSPVLRARFDVIAGPFLEHRGHDAALGQLDGVVLGGLAHVLASQGEAARYLSRRPQLLERLAQARAESLETRALELMQQAERESGVPDREPSRDLEICLDELRLLRRDETVFAACLDLGGGRPFDEVSRLLSSLAELCVARALREAKLHSPLDQRSPIAVLGMGKVAGRELTYHSDLDLVFLFPDTTPSPLQPAHLAQRLIVYLSTMTGAGVAYAVDSRLRPSGRQGALVSSYASFERYQLEHAAVWEHLTLMRARAIAGERDSAQALLDGIRHRLRVDPRRAWREIDAMRRRVETERAARRPGAFKTGAGGLMDVDFLAAGSLLERGPSDALPAIPDLLRTHVSGPRIERLLEDYAFLRRVEARTRWVVGRPVESVAVPGPHAAIIAELVCPGLQPRELAQQLRSAQTRIRAAYQEVVQSGSIAAIDAPTPADASRSGPDAS